MLRQIKYYIKAVARIFKHRKILVPQIDALLKEHTYRSHFLKAFGYWPEGLEYNAVEILKLSANARVGIGNRLILSKTKYPCGTRESLIMLGAYCWTGKNVEINVLTGTQVVIKNYTTIQDYSKIIGDVTIEKYCLFAPLVFVSSGAHYAEKNNPALIRNQDELHLSSEDLLSEHSKLVHIEEDCWIGYGAYIKQGTYVGRGTVIGANTIVTRDVLPYSIMGGVNNKINTRFDFNPPKEIMAGIPGHTPYFYRGFLQKNGECPYPIDGGFALGPDKGVIILQKGTPESIFVSGKVLNPDTSNKPELTIIYNGNLGFSTPIEIDEQGKFSLKAYMRDFNAIVPCKDDLVLRLVSDYNIFHVSAVNASSKTSSNGILLLALYQFAESISDTK